MYCCPFWFSVSFIVCLTCDSVYVIDCMCAHMYCTPYVVQSTHVYLWHACAYQMVNVFMI